MAAATRWAISGILPAMANGSDLAATARQIVDSSLYMVVSTADSSGQPWATPVFFAHEDYREFFWVSEPDATHSENLRVRREVGAVIFDSTVPIGSGQGVYILGVGRELPAHETDEGIAIYSERAVARGGSAWSSEDVRPPSSDRLYQATVESLSVLDEHDHRVELKL